MERQTELRLIREALEFKERGETQYCDSTQSHKVDRYISEQWFQREREQLFCHRPMPIGIANEVPNVGDYLAIDWFNGLSLLMVRDTENQIRIFANACRHRNARLVEKGAQGCKKNFSCPYHAWTYNTQGDLVGAPDFDRGFGDLDKEELGLIEFPSRVVEGVVYVLLDSKGSLPDELVPEEMVSGFKYLGIENQLVYKRRSYTIDANWKILSEGGIEAYHFNVAHRNTLAPFFLGNLSTWESWDGMNLRMILPKKPLLEAKTLPEDQWDLRKMANIIYSMSPSMLFLAQPDNISIIKMVPLNPNQTRIEEVLLVAPPEGGGSEWSEEELKMHETNHNLVNVILNEDWVLGETIQANMQSGAVKDVHFGRFESALTWFHNEYEEALGIHQELSFTDSF